MKRLQKPAVMLLASASVAQGEITPVNIVLHDGSASYAVPDGKVLVIEHFIWALEAESTDQKVAIEPANSPAGAGAFELDAATQTGYPDSWTPPRPIRLVGGNGANVHIVYSEGETDWRDVMIVGLLVDPEDLYAKTIPTELQNPRVENGRLVADARFASARPRTTRILGSEDLQRFEEDAGGEATEAASATRAVVSVPAEGDRKFLAVEAKTRPVED